jgi:haloacetate dehalogenase
MRAGSRLQCPVLVLWGERAMLEKWYDMIDVWRNWADDVRGRSLPCGHYLAEEAPLETSEELLGFFS